VPQALPRNYVIVPKFDRRQFSTPNDILHGRLEPLRSSTTRQSRPATGQHPMMAVRLPQELIEPIDALWPLAVQARQPLMPVVVSP
jgi:hypothetical protein